ncbi:hypothetical protein ACFLTA_09450 [Bacteroidota bacterium]
MKSNALLFSTIALLSLFITSCQIKEIQSEMQPGYFILSELRQENFVKSSPESGLKSSDADFFLGNLKASREFYFLLTNGGDQPIFNIKLQTGDDAFIISPDRIEILQGKTTADNSENPMVIPLLTVGILHGLQLNGTGYTDLLEMGSNSSYIQITGKTIDNGDTIAVANEFTLEVDASIMDIDISSEGIERDLTKWDGAVSSNLGGLGFVRYYKVSENQIEIKNTGNVSIKVYYGEDDKTIHSNSFILEPGKTKPIDINNSLIFIKLDSDGTITDDDRIQLGNDGNGYLGIHLFKEQPDPSPNPIDTTLVRF